MAAGRVMLAGRVSDGAVVVMIEHGARSRPSTATRSLRSRSAGATRSPPGSCIGTVGLTGHTTGPHLHFEIWPRAKPIDPLTVLPARK